METFINTEWIEREMFWIRTCKMDGIFRKAYNLGSN